MYYTSIIILSQKSSCIHTAPSPVKRMVSISLFFLGTDYLELCKERAILGLLSQFAHPRFLNTGAPGCLAGKIVGISDAVYPYLTIPDHF